MKKMSYLGLLAVLVLGFATAAQAADIKATGKWQIDASWSNDMDGNTLSKENNFRIEQRIRTAFQFIANENLKAVLDTQIGSNSWGNGQYQISAGRTPANNQTSSGSNVAGAGNIMLRKAYIDYKWPGTSVNITAGFQTVNLPAAFGGGSAILDDQVGSLVIAAPITDNVKILAGYARPYDGNTAGSLATVQTEGTGSNVIFAAVPVDFSDTNITPFAAYANAGDHAAGTSGATSRPEFQSPGTVNGASFNNYGLNGYWGGVAFTTKLLDPFKIMADFNYGDVEYTKNETANAAQRRSGWLADFAVDYTGLSMMTPEVFAVYSSGDGDSAKNGGRMPVLGNPQSWTVGSMYFGDGDLISRGATNNQTGSYNGTTRNNMGFWTAGVSLKDIKLIDKITHRVNLLYIQGTNDKNALVGINQNQTYANYGAYLTTKDSMWEIDLNTKYQIYDELSLGLNLGYINADLHPYNGQNKALFNAEDNMYRATVSLAYTF